MLYGVLWGIKDLLHCCWLVAVHLKFTRDGQFKHLTTCKLPSEIYFFSQSQQNIYPSIQNLCSGHSSVQNAAFRKQKEWKSLPD